MFINFANVLKTSPAPTVRYRPDREVVPKRDHAGNFVFRTREFEQMEMEFFVPPAESQEWYEYWCQTRMDWYLDPGMDPAKIKLRAHDDDELALQLGYERCWYLLPVGLDESKGCEPW